MGGRRIVKLLVSALEPSANVHLTSLHNELPDSVEFIGIFDKKLGDPIVDLNSLAIMGFVDALKKLRFFFKLRDEMLALAKDADKVLLMDSSGFNLPLAKSLKNAYPDKEIIYYILPQAWAWKQKRIPVLARTIDHLCSILPFEKDYYPPKAPITYVGHPLLDQIRRFKSAPTQNGVIAFMPGSRSGEIKRLMPIFRQLRLRFKERALLVVPSAFDQEKINAIYGDTQGFEISYNTHDALFESDFAFICSGTATLEAALIGTPFVLGYIARKFDAMIARMLVKLNYVGLANIMFEKMNGGRLHPELLQEAVSSDAFFNAYERMNANAFFEDAQQLKQYLSHGSAKAVAQILLHREVAD